MASETPLPPPLLVAKDPCLGNVFLFKLSFWGYFVHLVMWEMKMAQPTPMGSLQSTGLGAASSQVEHLNPLHGLVEVGWEGAVPPEQMVPRAPAGFVFLFMSLV